MIDDDRKLTGIIDTDDRSCARERWVTLHRAHPSTLRERVQLMVRTGFDIDEQWCSECHLPGNL